MGSHLIKKIVRMLLALVAVLICTNATPEPDTPRSESPRSMRRQALHDTLLNRVTSLFKNCRDAALERDLPMCGSSTAIREFALRQGGAAQLLEESSREAHVLLHEALGATLRPVLPTESVDACC